MNDRDRAALVLLAGQCCGCPDPRQESRNGPARPKVNGRPMTPSPQHTEDSTFIPDRPVWATSQRPGLWAGGLGPPGGGDT